MPELEAFPKPAAGAPYSLAGSYSVALSPPRLCALTPTSLTRFAHATSPKESSEVQTAGSCHAPPNSLTTLPLPPPSSHSSTRKPSDAAARQVALWRNG